MNITKENSDALTATISVSIDKADYSEKVENALKDYKKKANIKGFRPGMAPMGLIRKMYFKYILVEEVSKLASDSLYEYIKNENIKTLGEPIPSEKQASIDWDNQESFQLSWDLGLAPEFEVKFTKRDKFPYYKIAITDEIRKQHIDSLRNRFGKYTPIEVTDDKGLVKATLTELNEDESPRESGKNVEGASISIALVADEDERKKLIGCKVGDVVVIDTKKAFPNEADRAALLHVKKEELGELNSLFQLTITETLTFTPAEQDQAFYDQVYGKDVVKTEEDFAKKVDEELENYFKVEGDNRFSVDFREKAVGKLKFELPKDFLVRWLTSINEGKFTREQIEEEYPMFEKDLKWQLMSNKVAEEQNFTVTKEETEEFAKGYARSQFAAYGMNFLPDEYITKYANDILKNREELRKIQESIMNKKVVDWFKSTVALDEKEVTVEEFNKIGK